MVTVNAVAHWGWLVSSAAVPEGGSAPWEACGGPDGLDITLSLPPCLLFQVTLSPGTPWDRLAVRPCDVPCIVKLGPPLRGMAQTQPPLVGPMLRLFPPVPLDLGLGPWEGVYLGWQLTQSGEEQTG